MTQNQDKLSGIIEADETYMGGKEQRRSDKTGFTNKTSIIGMTERKGQAKAKVDYADATSTSIF